MDWLTFFAHLVTAIAWPAATIVLALSLRPAIKDLLRLLRKLKWNDLEAEFGRAARVKHFETPGMGIY